MLQCITVCCSVLQCVAVYYSVLQCIPVCCSVLQCVAVYYSVLQCITVRRSVFQCVAVYSSVLQCITVCCSVLQCHIMLQCASVWHASNRHLRSTRFYLGFGTISCTTYSMLQCIAVCYSMLQCAAVRHASRRHIRSTRAYLDLAPFGARPIVCCSMLQCVAVCCKVLQYVPAWCSVVQGVAIFLCASTLRRVKRRKKQLTKKRLEHFCITHFFFFEGMQHVLAQFFSFLWCAPCWFN